jgi:hypothetical protein
LALAIKEEWNGKLHEAEIVLAQGGTFAEACRRIGPHPASFRAISLTRFGNRVPR